MLIRRIVILGNSGTGKSTLAHAIGKRLKLPVVHLDTLLWEAGWVEPDAKILQERIRKAVAPDAWICEGNYCRRTFDLRLLRANLIIWFDAPCDLLHAGHSAQRVKPPTCRFASRLYRETEQGALVLPELRVEFDRVQRPGIEAARLTIGPLIPVIRVRGARQVSGFLTSLTAGAAVSRNQKG